MGNSEWSSAYTVVAADAEGDQVDETKQTQILEAAAFVHWRLDLVRGRCPSK